jgi:galactosyl transferase GMA12/MNN10 family
MNRVAIIQFDDRSDSELGPMLHLVARNAAYARERGYHHAFVRDHDNNVPVFWHKVALIERYLEDFEFVAWLDTDAVIHDFGLTIEQLFNGPERMIFSADLPIYPVPLPFNAGVFFCRGIAARELMSEWRALYPAHLWRRQGGQWNFQDHVWAGPAYEQGSFAEVLFPKYAPTPAFRQLSWKMLQSPYPLPESFTLHFANMFRPNAILYLNMLAGR